MQALAAAEKEDRRRGPRRDPPLSEQAFHVSLRPCTLLQQASWRARRDVEGMRGAGLFTTTLRDRSWLSEKAFQITLDRPSGFGFVPGQSITIVNGPVERDYSLACARILPDLTAVRQACSSRAPLTIPGRGPPGIIPHVDRASWVFHVSTVPAARGLCGNRDGGGSVSRNGRRRSQRFHIAAWRADGE